MSSVAYGREKRLSRRRAATVSARWVAGAFVGAVAVCAPAWHVVTGLLSDSYMTLYAGRWIATHGIPHQEVFTLAARGHPWIDRSGWPSSNLALPLFAVLLALCLTDAEREQPRLRMVLVLPLLVLWANVHGSVLLGAGLAAAYFAYRAGGLGLRGNWRSAAGCGTLAVLAVLTPLATPYGLHIVSYYRELLGNPAVAAAAPENRPPSFPDITFFGPLLLVLTAGTMCARKHRRIGVPLAAPVAVTAIATLIASRSAVWFDMTAAVLLAYVWQGWIPTKDPTQRFLASVAAATAGVASLGIALLLMPIGGGYERYTPVRAISAAAGYAAAHPGTKLLADDAASSAVLWHDPQMAGRVAYDARLERYPESDLERWIRFQGTGGNDWGATTAGYQVLVGSTAYDPALVRRLASMPKTRDLEHDARGITIVKN